MQTETSPVVTSLISAVLDEMIDENGALRAQPSNCCCAHACFTLPSCISCYFCTSCTFPEG